MKKKREKHGKSAPAAMAALLFTGLQATSAGAGLTLTCGQSLIFGEFSATCASATTITVRADDTRAITGSCVDALGAPWSRGICTVSQTFPFKTIQVTVPSTATLTRSGGSEIMDLSAFNLVTNAGGTTYQTTSAAASVPIGATLDPHVNSPPVVSGTYNGSFTVTAILQ